MNVRTERQTERQTDRPHELHVYVGLAQARPNNYRFVENCVEEASCILEIHCDSMKYFKSVFINAHIRPLLQLQSYIIIS